MDPGDCACEGVRARHQHQEEYKHHARKLVTEFAPDEAHSVGVVLDGVVLQFDLTNRVTGVHG